MLYFFTKKFMITMLPNCTKGRIFMKKIFSLLLCLICSLSLSLPAWAVDASQENEIRVGYAEYDLSELIGTNALTATRERKEVTAGTVTARLFNAPSGFITGKSPTFKISGLPSTAKITNVEAWNPSKSNITQGKYTAIEQIQVYSTSGRSGFFKYWVISAPTPSNPCNATGLNGLNPNDTYYIEITGRVLSNYTGMDGFTIKGTKVRVTYSY